MCGALKAQRATHCGTPSTSYYLSAVGKLGHRPPPTSRLLITQHRLKIQVITSSPPRACAWGAGSGGGASPSGVWGRAPRSCLQPASSSDVATTRWSGVSLSRVPAQPPISYMNAHPDRRTAVIVFHNPDEDREDARDAEEALAESGEPIPAADLWIELGVDDAAASE